MWIPTPQFPVIFNCTDHPHASYISHIFGLLIWHWQYFSRFMSIIFPISARTVPPTIHQTQLIHSNRQLNKLRTSFGFNNILHWSQALHWSPALYNLPVILDNTRTLQPRCDVVHVHTGTFGHVRFPVDIVTPTGNLVRRIECTHMLSSSTDRGNPAIKLQRGFLVRGSGLDWIPTHKVIVQVDSACELTTCCH